MFPLFDGQGDSKQMLQLIECAALPASEHTPPEIHNTPFVVMGAVFTEM